MNKPYRLGYNEGLELARMHRGKRKPYLSPGGLRLEIAMRYGWRRNEGSTGMKAGFRAGYGVGVQEAAVITEGRSERNGAHSTEGGRNAGRTTTGNRYGR